MFSDTDFRNIIELKQQYRLVAIPPIINPITIYKTKTDKAFHKVFTELPCHINYFNSIELVKDEEESITLEERN